MDTNEKTLNVKLLTMKQAGVAMNLAADKAQTDIIIHNGMLQKRFSQHLFDACEELYPEVVESHRGSYRDFYYIREGNDAMEHFMQHWVKREES